MVRRVAFLHPQQQLRVLTAGQLTDNREPILAGEGGIRTLDSLYGSVCYRFYVAKDAKFAMHSKGFISCSAGFASREPTNTLVFSGAMRLYKK
jgi:hypothetical protein